MSKEEKKTKKVICLPGWDEYPEMDVGELTKLKKKVEGISDMIARIIRKKIQK